MPELPEVENLRRYLIREGIPGHTFASATAAWPKTIKSSAVEDFILALHGRTVLDIHRRAKYLNLQLDRGSLILHMGMTGSLAIVPPESPPQRFAHTVFHLDDNRRIELNDPRKWASVWLVDDPDTVLNDIGPEPFDPTFTPDNFAGRVHPRHSPIKTVLMDQSVIAGVGNIYADEALHRAGISPIRRANRISAERLFRLHTEIVTVLNHAIDYIGDNPLEDGRPFVVDAYDDRMKIERRKGATCPTCQRSLKTNVFGNRTAYYCGHCQH